MTTELKEDVVEVLWDDGEFILSRVRHVADRSSTLLVQPVLDHSKASLARLKHALALRDDLDASWAALAVELIGDRGKLALRIEDPGGQVLASTGKA